MEFANDKESSKSMDWIFPSFWKTLAFQKNFCLLQGEVLINLHYKWLYVPLGIIFVVMISNLSSKSVSDLAKASNNINVRIRIDRIMYRIHHFALEIRISSMDHGAKSSWSIEARRSLSCSSASEILRPGWLKRCLTFRMQTLFQLGATKLHQSYKLCLLSDIII